MSFSDELRQKSKEVHDVSDKLINVKLVVVLTDTKLWAEALSEFYVVYRAIEDAVLRWRDDPQLTPLLALVETASRTTAFERDLEFYLGSEWRSIIKPSVHAQEYCARVAVLADEDPLLLIAYVHAMYLAMLAGGQMMKRIIKNTLHLHGDEGLKIFEFKEVDQKQLREQIKSTIDKLELSRKTKDAIIAENIHCFRMNIQIVKAIHVNWSNYQKLGMIVAIVMIVLVVAFFYWHELFSF